MNLIDDVTARRHLFNRNWFRLKEEEPENTVVLLVVAVLPITGFGCMPEETDA